MADDRHVGNGLAGELRIEFRRRRYRNVEGKRRPGRREHLREVAQLAVVGPPFPEIRRVRAGLRDERRILRDVRAGDAERPGAQGGHDRVVVRACGRQAERGCQDGGESSGDDRGEGHRG